MFDINGKSGVPCGVYSSRCATNRPANTFPCRMYNELKEILPRIIKKSALPGAHKKRHQTNDASSF